MIKIVMIRHFATEGNLQKRYIGVTNEPICECQKDGTNPFIYPNVQGVFASPLLRCQQTARLIYPYIPLYCCNDFRECDFGEFENKNYIELKDNKNYQTWIHSNGALPFPGGENPEHFKARTNEEFYKVLQMSIKLGYKAIALIVHGGTIMSILERYAAQKREFYSWNVENGNGYIGEFDEKEGRIIHLCTIL